MTTIADHKFANSDFTGKGATALPDRPNQAGMDAAAVKAALDYIGKSMIAMGKHNDLIDNLLSSTDGNSGADSIGVTAIPNVTGTKLQTVLESLKALIDAAVTGNIPDNSLGEIKMKSEMKKDVEGGVASYGLVSTHTGEVVSQHLPPTTHNLATAGVQTITGLTGTPKRIEIRAAVNDGVTLMFSTGSWETNGPAQSCILIYTQSGAVSGLSTTAAVQIATNAANYASGAVQNVTSSQFEISWTKTGSPTGTITMEIIAHYH